MALAVITVASGGLPVTDVTATKPALGMAVTEAIAVGTAKWGRPVTKVPNGLPVTFVAVETGGGGGGTTYTTWNPADKSASITLSNGNLTAAVSSGGNASVRSTVGSNAGKRYCEITVTGTIAVSDMGFRTVASSLGAHVDLYVQTTDGGVWRSGSFQGYSMSGNNSFVSGDVLGMAIDFTALRVWFRRNNGTWNNGGSADPATGVGGIDVSSLFTGVAAYPSVFLGATSLNFTLNVGATAFAYAIPSGFTAGWTVSNPAADFLARTSGLDATHTNAYTALINGLVTDGIWDKLDVFHIYATQDSTTAKLNLVSSSFTATANGSPTFTADRGFTGVNGSSTVYIDTGFNAWTAPTPKFVQNSAHVSAWSVTNIGSSGQPIIGVRDNSNTNTIIYPVNSSVAYFLLNNDWGGSVANANSSGHYIGSRTGANSIFGYKNGAGIYSDLARMSYAPVNRNIYVLGCNHDLTLEASGYQCAMASIGSSLDATQAANFYTRLRTFMTAVGVP